MHGTILGIFCSYRRIERNVCKLSYSIAGGCKRYGIAFFKYAVLLVFLFGICSYVLFIVCANRPCKWRMDNLSSVKCTWMKLSDGSKIGMDLWLISMSLFIVSQLLAGLNYISTILNMRTKGMSMTRMPLTIWALFFTAVLGVLSFPVLLSGCYTVII